MIYYFWVYDFLILLMLFDQENFIFYFINLLYLSAYKFLSIWFYLLFILFRCILIYKIYLFYFPLLLFLVYDLLFLSIWFLNFIDAFWSRKFYILFFQFIIFVCIQIFEYIILFIFHFISLQFCYKIFKNILLYIYRILIKKNFIVESVTLYKLCLKK